MSVSDTVAFFEQFYEGAHHNIELRSLLRNGKPGPRLFSRDSKEIAEYLTENAKLTQYFGVATRESNCNGTKEDCREVPALFTDIDFKTTGESGAKELLAKFPFPPSLLINSGGGRHAYWILNKPADARDPKLESVLRGMVRRLSADAHCAQIACVLRPPGTFNWKYTPEREVTIVQADWDRRYDLTDFSRFEMEKEPTAVASRNGDRGRVPVGQRYDFLLSRAGEYRRKGDSEEVGLKKVLIDFESSCEKSPDDGKSGLKETKQMVHKVGNYPRAAGAEDHSVFRRDVANAALYAQMHAGSVIWCAEQETWYAWDGKRYVANNSGEVMRKARETVRHMYEVALAESDSDTRKTKLNWAIRSESRLEKMVSYAASESKLVARSFNETFDLDKYLFNCANGVLNLRTGELLPHDQKYRITKLSPVGYDSEAACTEFMAWLTLTCNGSAALVEYLLRFIGYCLSGLTEEQCFWLFYGPTKTGKSTFIRLLRGLMGDYATTLPEGAVIMNRFSNQEHALAELAGVRLATLVEVRQGADYDEAKLKQITGQDRIGASKKYMNYFEFDSRAKLAMAVNDRPAVRETGDAFWNRVKPIPFTVFVPPEKRIPDLEQKFLDEEGPGIMAAVVAAFRRWRKEGMMEPKEVTGAATEYRNEQDTVAQFIEETCIRKQGAQVTASGVYRGFVAWCSGQRRPMSKIRFGKELGRLGFTPDRDRTGKRCWNGLELLHAGEDLFERHTD
jgi:P4 family phage/plasmid primase-like protien